MTYTIITADFKILVITCVSVFYLLFSISRSKLHDYLSHESIGQGILQRCPVTVLIQESRIVMIIYKASKHWQILEVLTL